MTMFWLGIIVFLIGIAFRYFYKYKYYRDYTKKAVTPRMADEMKAKYRPMIFIGLGIEVIGCIIALISAFR